MDYFNKSSTMSGCNNYDRCPFITQELQFLTFLTKLFHIPASVIWTYIQPSWRFLPYYYCTAHYYPNSATRGLQPHRRSGTGTGTKSFRVIVPCLCGQCTSEFSMFQTACLLKIFHEYKKQILWDKSQRLINNQSLKGDLSPDQYSISSCRYSVD